MACGVFSLPSLSLLCAWCVTSSSLARFCPGCQETQAAVLMVLSPFAPMRRLDVDACFGRGIDPFSSVLAAREHECVDSLIVRPQDRRRMARLIRAPICRAANKHASLPLHA